MFMRGFGTDAESSALVIVAVCKAKYTTTVARQKKTKRKQRTSMILSLSHKNSDPVYHVLLPVFFVVASQVLQDSLCALRLDGVTPGIACEPGGISISLWLTQLKDILLFSQ